MAAGYEQRRNAKNFGGWPYILLPIAGGLWGDGSDAGVFALDVALRRSGAAGRLGFRAALLRTSEGAALRGYAQYTKRNKGAILHAPAMAQKKTKTDAHG